MFTQIGMISRNLGCAINLFIHSLKLPYKSLKFKTGMANIEVQIQLCTLSGPFHKNHNRDLPDPLHKNQSWISHVLIIIVTFYKIPLNMSCSRSSINDHRATDTCI